MELHWIGGGLKLIGVAEGLFSALSLKVWKSFEILKRLFAGLEKVIWKIGLGLLGSGILCDIYIPSRNMKKSDVMCLKINNRYEQFLQQNVKEGWHANSLSVSHWVCACVCVFACMLLVLMSYITMPVWISFKLCVYFGLSYHTN